jgi:hypothetical protein
MRLAGRLYFKRPLRQFGDLLIPARPGVTHGCSFPSPAAQRCPRARVGCLSRCRSCDGVRVCTATGSAEPGARGGARTAGSSKGRVLAVERPGCTGAPVTLPRIDGLPGGGTGPARPLAARAGRGSTWGRIRWTATRRSTISRTNAIDPHEPVNPRRRRSPPARQRGTVVTPRHGPPRGSGAAAPHGALRAIDSSARPRLWAGLRPAPPAAAPHA